MNRTNWIMYDVEIKLNNLQRISSLIRTEFKLGYYMIA